MVFSLFTCWWYMNLGEKPLDRLQYHSKVWSTRRPLDPHSPVSQYFDWALKEWALEGDPLNWQTKMTTVSEDVATRIRQRQTSKRQVGEWVSSNQGESTILRQADIPVDRVELSICESGDARDRDVVEYWKSSEPIGYDTKMKRPSDGGLWPLQSTVCGSSFYDWSIRASACRIHCSSFHLRD